MPKTIRLLLFAPLVLWLEQSLPELPKIRNRDWHARHDDFPEAMGERESLLRVPSARKELHRWKFQ
jgi:hypothetical protein